MRDAVIVSAVRTALGKAPKGMLRATRPDDLAAVAIQGALGRVPGLDKKEVEDVIIGCAMPEGEQGMNVARVAALRAGMPIESAAMTINRYCASGLQAIALAVERIRGGGAEVIVAGGTESMSFIPFGGNKISFNPWLQQHYPDSYLSMGLSDAGGAGRGEVPARDCARAGYLFGARREIEDPQDGTRVPGRRGAARRYFHGGAGQAQGRFPRQRHGHRGQLQIGSA